MSDANELEKLVEHWKARAGELEGTRLALEHELREIKSVLADPMAVQLNIANGRIAEPTHAVMDREELVKVTAENEKLKAERIKIMRDSESAKEIRNRAGDQMNSRTETTYLVQVFEDGNWRDLWTPVQDSNAEVEANHFARSRTKVNSKFSYRAIKRESETTVKDSVLI